MDINVYSAIYLTTFVRGQVYISKDVDFAAAKTNIMDQLRAFFDYDQKEPDDPMEHTIDFGKTIRWSRVVGLIQKSYGVAFMQNFKFNALAVNTDLTLTDKQIPALDDSNFDSLYSGGGLEFIQLT